MNDYVIGEGLSRVEVNDPEKMEIGHGCRDKFNCEKIVEYKLHLIFLLKDIYNC